MAEYSRNFKSGQYRYATRACIDEDVIIIKQTERCDVPKLEYRSVIVLPIEDFKKMISVLELEV